MRLCVIYGKEAFVAMLVFKTLVMRMCVFMKWVGKGDFSSFIRNTYRVGNVPAPARDTRSTHA